MRRPVVTISEGARSTCFSCMRPSSHCICNLIAAFEAHCKILILQHPHERKKYYSTAKLVIKGITNARLLRGIEFSPEMLAETLPAQNTYLLFPHTDALDCTEVALGSDSTVIVIDGTWAEAGKILHRNPFLKTFPCLTFRTAIRSSYRIRKQPKAHYLSTIESIGHLLRLNAVSRGLENLAPLYDSLFEGFSKMVEKQLQHIPTEHWDLPASPLA